MLNKSFWWLDFWRKLLAKLYGGRMVMKGINRQRISAIAILLIAFVGSAPAQWDKKPYTEWSEKDATKILNDSAWGQTQTYTDTSNMTGNNRMNSSQSRISDVTNVDFRIRFLSAKPIRQAFSRIIELQQKGEVSESLAKQLSGLANADFPDYAIVTVLCDAKSQSNKLQQATAALYKFTTAELKPNTYLQAKGGQRIFLQEYQPPRKDGLGARFVFPRVVDGKPILTPESGEVLFHSELPELIVLNMRYKVKDMMFNGKLEY
jgi:hypothetical protein